MAQLVETSLTRYELTEQEFLNGSLLSPENRMVIQNMIADDSESLLNIKFDPAAPIKAALEQAALQGRIEALKYVLASCDAAVARIQEIRAIEAEQNQQ